MRLFFALILCVVATFSIPAMAGDGGNYNSPLTIVTATNGAQKYKVEIARTAAARTQGLMFRNAMPKRAGMLFIFPDNDERHFWMKNTLIPLDLIFIRGDGVIHHIHEGAKPLDLSAISSSGPVPMVLELNAGAVRAAGIAIGDQVYHVDLGKALAPGAGNK